MFSLISTEKPPYPHGQGSKKNNNVTLKIKDLQFLK